MPFEHSSTIPFSRPRALIADDSRIVRATLCKHLSDLFDFSEALDGEGAWEILLRDQEIDLLITDLTMPRLDGYGLLRRMRASLSEHLRNMPVVVLSGTDDADERRQAKEAGATDLIIKGMPTAQLLSRLDVLAQLVIAQKHWDTGMEAGPALSPYVFQAQAERLLGYAVRQQQDFTLISLSIAETSGITDAAMRAGMARRLRLAIRQTDLLACTGGAEFSIATASLEPAAARGFAQRLCDMATQALVPDGMGAAVACCGTATLAETRARLSVTPSLHEIWEAARRRCQEGLKQGRSGAIGAAEESTFRGK